MSKWISEVAMRSAAPSLLAAAAIFSGLSCGGDSLEPPTTGTVRITAATTGAEPDADGYLVITDGGSGLPVGANATVEQEQLEPGDHTVLLSGIAANCSVAGANPRTINLPAGGTATAVFEVTCTATSGSLVVTSSTTGASPDLDGYNVTLDGNDGATLGATGEVTLSGLAPANHQVGLSGIAANCQAAGNPRTVAVTSGVPATAAFVITCVAAPPASGTLQVTTVTTGASPDLDGYSFAIDVSGNQTIGINATVTLPNVAAGSRSVTLSGLASNCQVEGDNPRAVGITPGATATAAFVITCPTAAPGNGTLEVTTVTTGANQDADGYSFVTDGGAAQAIGLNATATVAPVAAGPHTVTLSGVATNCTVQATNPRAVDVAAAATTNVSFTIACTTTTGSLEISTATTGPSPDPDGYTVSLDNESAQAIANTATLTIPGLAPGTHTVTLAGMADNCIVGGENPRTVSVTAGQQATVRFAIECRAASARYRVTDLGTLGGVFSQGNGINPSVQVAGRSHFSGGTSREDPAVIHGFLWQDGTMSDLGSFAGPGGNSWANGINPAGQVVGWSELPLQPDEFSPQIHAFLWQGTMTDLGAFEPGGASWANAINSAGQVVGWATGTECCERAFLWQNGVMRDLGTLGGNSSQAHAINSGGQIVGTSLTPDREFHAFLWQNGGMVDLGTLGGEYSEARGINAAGQVVGSSTTRPGENGADGTAHAFLWENGVMRDLGVLGGNQSHAYAINSAGQVVGWTTVSHDAAERGFIWQNGVMTELTTPRGGESQGLGINDAGQIAGLSIGPNGSTQATLWTPE